ncbi:hypothetical protein TYM08_P2074 [Marinicellulosiphila megalodicopiae]
MDCLHNNEISVYFLFTYHFASLIFIILFYFIILYHFKSRYIVLFDSSFDLIQSFFDPLKLGLTLFFTILDKKNPRWDF